MKIDTAPVVEREAGPRPVSNPETDSTRRDAIARSLCARISDDRRTVDELRVLDVILTRISGGGAEQYGGMVLATDHRDFVKEASDEFADALWYMAAHVVRTADERAERLACEAADELAKTEGLCRPPSIDDGLRELVYVTTPEQVDDLLGRGHGFGDLMKSHLPVVVGGSFCNVCGQRWPGCSHSTPAPLPEPVQVDVDSFDDPTDRDASDVDRLPDVMPGDEDDWTRNPF
jgi:hypothetical protein